MLLGSPLKSTYSAIDTSFASNAVNLSFYTQFSSQWFWMHLVGLAMVFWLYKKGKLKAEYLLLLLVMVVFNYLFYSFKLISMNYYTYATAFILIGFILHELSLVKMKESWQASVKWSVLGIYVIMFVAGLIEFSKFEKPTFTQSAKTYQELKPYNIVCVICFLALQNMLMATVVLCLIEVLPMLENWPINSSIRIIIRKCFC